MLRVRCHRLRSGDRAAGLSCSGGRSALCDARPVLPRRARGSRPPTRSCVEWPNRYLAAQGGAGEIDARTAVSVLTHARDEPARLEVALRLPPNRIPRCDGVTTHGTMTGWRERGGRQTHPAAQPDPGSTWVRAPPRRPRCRSPPKRSSPPGGARGPPADRDRRPDSPRNQPIKRSLNSILSTPAGPADTGHSPSSEVGHMQVPGPFEYERATSVDHARRWIRLGDGAGLAGGHSLLPMMKLRIANPEYLVGERPCRRARVHHRRARPGPDRCDGAAPPSARERRAGRGVPI